MANLNTPPSKIHKGWFFDSVNGRLEIYYNATKVGHVNASGMTITDDTTTYMSNSVVQSAGIAASAIATNQIATAARTFQEDFGWHTALASNAAGGIVPDSGFVATANMQLVSAWALNVSGTDVTTGTATSSASYRRVTIITNTAGTGSGTNIVASLNATASLAAGGTRAFTIAASTIPAGAVVLISQTTVGAATADGTDAATRRYLVAYQLV